ncbi:MAG: TonB-dependent receptor [Opitutaceae bacterium]|nr:TonB-dependent receptor [Opitutaceae bacterium]
MLRLLRVYGFTLATLALASAAFAAAGTAAITGTITNAATGRALEGARVVLGETGRETLTDNLGNYRFEGVAPGAITISVSYTGLDSASAQATVQTGEVNRRDFGLTSQVYQMSQFVVAGEREGNAQAVTLQRLSTGVKNIVSTDAFGNLAQNPADLLVRLPGIEGDTVDGTIRYVRIRGLNQNLTTITMDGNRLADAASGGSTREYQFQTVSADTVERLEVVKSPTPDMDGDSIGGAVNMVSKTGFDTKGRFVRISAGLTYRPFDERMTGLPYNYAVSYSESFADKLAVSINFGHRQLFTPQDTVTQTALALANGATGPTYTNTVGYVDEQLVTSRWGGGVRLDYKLGDRTRLYFGSTINRLTDHDTDRILSFTSSAAGVAQGFTDTFTTILPIAASTVNIQADNAYKDARTNYHQFGAIHKLTGLEVDWNLYKSDSKSNYAGQRNFGYTARGIGFTVDQRGRADFPVVTQTAGPSITDPASFTENRYTINRRAGWDNYRGISLNAKQSFTTPVPAYVKIGGKIREQSRVLEATQWTGSYVGPDGVMGPNAGRGGANDDNLAQFGQIARGRLHTDDVRFPPVPVPAWPGHTNNLLDEALARNPTHFIRDTQANIQAQLNGDQEFDEKISAAYLMGHMQLDRLSVLFGARIEWTKTRGEGALQALTPEERARRAAFTGPLTEAEIIRRNIAEFGGRQVRTGSYRNVLPGVHLKYAFTPRLIGRASWATNIGRPGIGQLIPRTTVNFDATPGTIVTSNPSLKPQTADNFDLAVEYYFEPAGVVSVGVFQKDIKNFIFTAGGQTVGSGAGNGFGGDYAGYTLTTQYNGGSAKVRGLELNYSQQFAFLPGWLGGFGVYANLTRMETEGNYGAGNSIAVAPNPKGKVAGFNPDTSNAGISYIRNKITVRLQWNHRGRYLQTYNAVDSQLLYRIRRDTLDVKTQYQFTRRLSAYLDVNNVLGEYETGQDRGPRPSQRRVLTPGFFGGVNVRL